MTTIHAELAASRETIVLLAGGGDPHQTAFAAKRLGALTPLFSKSDPPGALTVPATWAAVVQLSATFGPDWQPGPALRAWATEQVMARTSTADVTYTPPAGLTPYPWQVEGQALIAATGRALIWDEPRTGKTATAILGLVELGAFPAIVICPASVVDPWVEAWQAWAPHIRTVAWHGAKRKALAGTADVYVTSYETARIDAPGSPAPKSKQALQALNPAAVVIDEAHLIKNHGSARSKAARRLTAIAVKNKGAVICLTGTPITHHPGDLWPSLEAIEPGAYPSSERWISRYCMTVQGDYKEENLGIHPAMDPEFRLTILGQHRRIARADVMGQLPPKVYSQRTVELPEVWRKVYDDFEAQMLAELPDGDELSVMDVLSKLSHLASLASSACDVEVTYGPDVDEYGELKKHVHLTPKAPSWKVDTLLEVLDERPGDPVLVFAPRRQLIELAGTAATAAGHRVGYIVGGQSKRVRSENRLAFQSGELDVLCATTGAGGVGITLNRAETVVYLQRPYSLVDSVQSEDRSEGDFNATRGTEVIDVIARNTLDSRVRAVLRERAGQLADLVRDQRIVTELLGGTRSTERKAS